MGDAEERNPSKSPGGSTPGGVRSALRSMPDAEKEIRLDRHGNRIEKGGTHHMSFVDEQKPGKDLKEVKEVQAYKNRQAGCGCTIL